MAHYLDDLTGCGDYLEIKCKDNFFRIIKSVLNMLLGAKSEDRVLELMKSL